MSFIKIRASLLPFLALGAALGLVSCASGPTYTEIVKTLPPIPKGKGRVFVYREDAIGMAVRPKIKIDDQPIGTSKAQGFSYSDQTVGQHVVSLTTETTKRTTVAVTAGQPSFVQTHMGFGVLVGHVVPTFVDKLQGEAGIRDCKLVTE